MATYLHTMLRITDPNQSRAFYEALGFTFTRDMDIVRDGQLEATNGYGHIAIGVDDLDDTLSQLNRQGIDPEREPYRVREGGSRICFVSDPDGYRTELIDRSGK